MGISLGINSSIKGVPLENIVEVLNLGVGKGIRRPRGRNAMKNTIFEDDNSISNAF